MKLVSVLLLCVLQCQAETVLITGEIESENTQHVLMPLVPSFQGNISEMISEGTKVKKGDFLMRADGTSVNNQLEAQVEQIAVFKSNAKKNTIKLKISLNQANIAHENAKINFQIAEMKAGTPLEFIGELAYKNNQLVLKNADKSFKKALNDYNEAQIKIKEDAKELNLGLVQKNNKLKYLQKTLDDFTLYANQEGYVIYATQWSGEKVQVGDQIQSGREVLSVSKKIDLQIVAWINAIDIPKLKLGQVVSIEFDAYMGQKLSGEIKYIASGGEDKKTWGDAFYYKAIVKPTEKMPANLLLGMSAMIEVKL